MIEVRRSTTSIRRSLGMMMTESTCFSSAEMPSSARRVRWAPSKVNGPRDHAHGQRALLARRLGDHRRRPGARAAALAGGHEDHVGAADGLLQLLAALLGGGRAHPRVGARAEALGDRAADVHLDVGVRHRERLGVGVDGDELHPANAGVDHPVDGVRAAAADPHHLDHGQVVARLHLCSPPGRNDLLTRRFGQPSSDARGHFTPLRAVERPVSGTTPPAWKVVSATRGVKQGSSIS